MDSKKSKPTVLPEKTEDKTILQPKRATFSSYGRAPDTIVLQPPEHARSKGDTTDVAFRAPQKPTLDQSPQLLPEGKMDSKPTVVSPVEPPAKASVGEEIEPITASPQTSPLDDPERYNMQHKRRGVALIFNHKTFNASYLPEREEAAKDELALQRVLRMLSFEVRCHEDLTYAELEKTLRDVAEEDHNDADCLFVGVLTHGETSGLIHLKDRTLNIEDIWSHFTEDKAPSLAGKPKIFLFQACHRSTEPGRISLARAIDIAGDRVYALPTSPDFIFAHSSVEGYHSWKNSDEGSWFLHDFCKELEESVGRKDIFTIMTSTLRRFALTRMSRVEELDRNFKKQMPIISSTLSKCLYFNATAV